MSLWNGLFGHLSQPMTPQDMANQAYCEQLAGLQNRDDLRYQYWVTRLSELPLSEEEQAQVLDIVDKVLERHAAKCNPVA